MPEEYERIWLRSRNEPFSLDEQTFFTVKVDDRDIEYVRADILASQVAPPADAVERAREIVDDVLDDMMSPHEYAATRQSLIDRIAAALASQVAAETGGLRKAHSTLIEDVRSLVDLLHEPGYRNAGAGKTQDEMLLWLRRAIDELKSLRADIKTEE